LFAIPIFDFVAVVELPINP